MGSFNDSRRKMNKFYDEMQHVPAVRTSMSQAMLQDAAWLLSPASRTKAWKKVEESFRKSLSSEVQLPKSLSLFMGPTNIAQEMKRMQQSSAHRLLPISRLVEDMILVATDTLSAEQRREATAHWDQFLRETHLLLRLRFTNNKFAHLESKLAKGKNGTDYATQVVQK